MAERFRAREGHYPSRILVDKICRNRENLSYCNAHGIRLSGPALGRPKSGMGLVTAKLRETAAHVIAMSVLVLKLRKIQRALLRMLAYLLEILAQNKNRALVQWTLCKHRKGLSDDGRRKNLVRHYAGVWRVIEFVIKYREM